MKTSIKRQKVLQPYDRLYFAEETYLFLKSGRSAGKSKAGAQFIVSKFFEEDGDIFAGRAYGSDVQQSIMQEILTVTEELGLINSVETRTRPLKIINKRNGNRIHFMGIGGSDIHRTKGFVPNKKLSLIAFDELQQVETQSHLEEAKATLLRHLKEDGKVLYMFNPDRRASHWLNEHYRLKKHDDNYLCLSTTYKDIAGILNIHTLREIEVERETNPSEYRYRYLGETEGLFGAVYASFNRDLHLVSKDIAKLLVKKIGYAYLIVGADPASTRDCTALVPLILLRNGQMIAVDYFYHNPQKNGVITNDRITPLIEQWINYVMDDWGIRRNHRVDFIFDTGAHSRDLMDTLNYRLPTNFSFQTYNYKKIVEMADVVKSTFSRNVLFISDSGGYYNYVTQRFVRGDNPLVQQLEQVVWNERGDGFDNNVPNDMTDALTYGTVAYFKNKDNMYYPEPKQFYKPLDKDDLDA